MSSQRPSARLSLGSHRRALPPIESRAKLSAEVWDEAAGEFVYRPDTPELLLCLSCFADSVLVRFEVAISPSVLEQLRAGGEVEVVTEDASGASVVSFGDAATTFTVQHAVLQIGPERVTITGEAESRVERIRRAFSIAGSVSPLAEVEVHDRSEKKAVALGMKVLPWLAKAATGRHTLELEPGAAYRVAFDLREPEPMPEPPAVASSVELVPITYPDGDGPTDRKPLVLEGRARAVRSTHLVMQGNTLVIEIDVDARSGEDGAPAPTLRFVGKDALRSLSGLVIEEHDGELEAWFGNDAEQLTNNRIEGLPPTRDGRPRFRRTAEYVAGPERRPFLFEGPVKVRDARARAKEAARARAAEAKRRAKARAAEAKRRAAVKTLSLVPRTDPAGEVSLSVPENWKRVRTPLLAMMFVARAPLDAAIKVAHAPLQTTLRKYVSGSIDLYRANGTIEHKGRDEVVYLQRSPSRRVMKRFLAADGRIAVVTCECAPEQSPALRSLFSKILRSAKLSR